MCFLVKIDVISGEIFIERIGDLYIGIRNNIDRFCGNFI